MEFTQALNELIRRPLWLVAGAAVAVIAALSTGYHISALPPSLESKKLAVGAADTQILIDSRRSALTDLSVDFDPLAKRASVFTRFMTSLPVRQQMADEIGIPVEQLLVEAPLQADVPKAAQEPVAAERANQLLGENDQYRLRFQTDTGLPTVTILAQAPSAEDATRLADGAAAGFTKYIERLERQQRVPRRLRAEVRQLGNAEGGLIAENVNVRLAVIVGIAAFVGWCLLVLLGVNVARNMRELRRNEGAGDPPEHALP